MAKMIICADCGEEKRHHALGLCGKCYKRHYYKENAEKCCGYARNHYHRNRDRCLARTDEFRRENKEYFRRYRIEHREERNMYNRQWRKKNPEKARAKDRRERLARQDKRRRQYREWYAKNKDERRMYRHVWENENPEKRKAIQSRRRARKRGAISTLIPQEIEELLEIGQAVYPGEELHLDHIVPISRGGGTTRANCHYIPAGLNISKKDKFPAEVYEQLSFSGICNSDDYWRSSLREGRASWLMKSQVSVLAQSVSVQS